MVSFGQVGAGDDRDASESERSTASDGPVSELSSERVFGTGTSWAHALYAIVKCIHGSSAE